MIHWKKTISFFVTGLLLSAVLAGCGSESQGSAPGAGTEAKAGQEAVTLRIMGKNKLTSYKDEQVLFADWIKAQDPVWLKLSEDLQQLGITLDLNLIEEDQYDTVCQTQLAAGLDCDMMNITPLDDNTRLNMVKQKRIVPLNEIWDQYSDGTAKAFFTSGDGAPAAAKMSLEDGNVYWLTDMQTSTFGDKVIGGTLGFSIRKDWLDKLGLPFPSTTDELFETLKAFQDQDVNGSGQKDEVLDIAFKGFNTTIAQWFNLGAGITFVNEQEGGRVQSPWYQENVKAYIAYMKKLVENGLVDTSEQASQKTVENKISGFSNWACEAWIEPQVVVPEGEAAAYYSPFIAKAIDGQEPWIMIQNGYQTSSRGYAVTSECKHPEAVAKLLDYMCKPEFVVLTEYGVKDYTYSEDSSGIKTRLFGTTNALWTNDSIFPRFDIGKHMEEELNQIVETGRTMGYPEEGFQGKHDYSVMCYGYKYTTSHDPDTNYAFPTEAELQRISAITTDLTTYSEELLTKLILGQKSMDSWDTYVSDLKRLGLDELIQINQARYDRASK